MKSPKKPKATAEEKELERVSVAQWNDYAARYRPAEAELIRRAELTEGEKARVTGEAAADTAGAFKGLTRSTVASNLATGADASSGRNKFALAADAQGFGEARGLGAGAALTGARIDSDVQKVGIAGLGRQIATGATADLSRGARRATNLALAAADAKHQRNLNRLSAAATIAGAGFHRAKSAFDARKTAADEARIIDELGIDISDPFAVAGSRNLGEDAFRRLTSDRLQLFDG